LQIEEDDDDDDDFVINSGADSTLASPSAGPNDEVHFIN